MVQSVKASTDTGLDSQKEPLATFAYVTPENPHGLRKLTDFASLSVYETVESGQTTRTRPLCPYPQVARCQGTGNVDDAANFACVALR